MKIKHILASALITVLVLTLFASVAFAKQYNSGETEKIEISESGSRKYKLEFTDGNGNDISLPLAYAVSETELKLGDNDNDLVLKERESIAKNDYFIVSSKGNTFVLRYKGADKMTADNPVIKFDLLGEGIIERSAKETGDGIVTTLRLGGQTYNIYAASDTSLSNYEIKVDMNANGKLRGKANIVTKFGSRISIRDNAPKNAFVRIKTSKAIAEVITPLGTRTVVRPKLLAYRIDTTIGPEITIKKIK